MFLERLVLGDLQANCWVVADSTAGPCVVIDPAGSDADAVRVIDACGDRGVALVVLTHAHFDHLGSARALVEATGAPLAIHEIDAPRITSHAPDGTGGALFGYSDTAPPADRILREGDVVEAGDLALEVWLTPGHTAGSICLVARDRGEAGPLRLFSGDTLFAGSVGRTDFPAGDGRALRRSIARIATLPDDTIVHPGHGPDTTVGHERRLNPFFPRA